MATPYGAVPKQQAGVDRDLFITSQVKELKSRLAELVDVTDEMCRRLEPVLQRQIEAQSENVKDVPRPLTNHPPLGESLEEANTILAYQITRFHDMVSRLEV